MWGDQTPGASSALVATRDTHEHRVHVVVRQTVRDLRGELSNLAVPALKKNIYIYNSSIAVKTTKEWKGARRGIAGVTGLFIVGAWSEYTGYIQIRVSKNGSLCYAASAY